MKAKRSVINMMNKTKEEPLSMRHEKLTEEVIIYILTRDTAELSLLSCESIAQKFEVSEDELCKKFKKETQVSLPEYIESARIHHAAELLKEKKEMGIPDIMNMVGIEDRQNFNKKFKKILGIDPVQYMELFSDR
jgi:YesN/AraC family two-component response regulator